MTSLVREAFQRLGRGCKADHKVHNLALHEPGWVVTGPIRLISERPVSVSLPEFHSVVAQLPPKSPAWLQSLTNFVRRLWRCGPHSLVLVHSRPDAGTPFGPSGEKLRPEYWMGRVRDSRNAWPSYLPGSRFLVQFAA